MSIRAEYETRARCKGMTLKTKTQCTREAIYFHNDGKGYCQIHHNKIYEAKKNEAAKKALVQS